MLVLGITGGIGSGKGLATEFFQQRGAVIVDADEIAQQLTGPGSPLVQRLAGEFGPQVMLPDGRLDRKALAKIAFASPEQTARLNAMTHSAIIAEAEHRLAEARQRPEATMVCLVAPLLLEAGLGRGIVDRILVMTAEEKARIRRVMERDGATEAEVKQRMAAQMSPVEQARQADWVVDTTAGKEQARAQLERVWQELLAV